MGFLLSLFVCGKIWIILRVNLHYKYHSLHYGDASSRTGGDAGGGHGGDEQFGSRSSIQSCTWRPPRLPQVCCCFGNNDGIGHCGSGGGLYPAFLHVHAIIQPGKKRFIALIESSLSHYYP